MSLSRSSSSAITLIRSISSRSQVSSTSRICHDCLVHPASCRISNLVAASTISSARIHARWQSTLDTSHAAPSTLQDLPPPVQASSSIEQHDLDATPSASTSTSTSTSSTTLEEPSPTPHSSSPESPSMPTPEDLETLKPRKLQLPRVADSTTSPEVGLYIRRFKRLSSRVEKAFNKDQLVHLARRLTLIRPGTKTIPKKKDIVRRILTDHWGMLDPAVIAAAEQAKKEGRPDAFAIVAQDIPVTDKELFFLLGRSDGSELLRRLTQKTTVRANIRGSATSPSLHLSGPSEQLEVVKKEWTKLKGEMVTSTVPITQSTQSLRGDLYKAISLATDTYVQLSSDKKSIEITSRYSHQAALGKVSALLDQLHIQAKIMSSSPRFRLSASATMQDQIMLPLIPQGSLPWHLQSLPILSFTRLTSLQNSETPKPLYRAGSSEAIDIKELEMALLQPLESAHGSVKIKASFGHLIRLAPQAEISVKEVSEQEWAEASEEVFLPATPPGTANRYSLDLRRTESRQVEEHTENLSIKSQFIRRLLYISQDATISFKFIELHRPQSRPTLEGQTIDPSVNPWKGEMGVRSFAHVAMPYSTVDLRLEASKSQEAPPEILSQFAEVDAKQAPPMLELDGQSYRLVEDYTIRASTFKTGLLPPFDTLQQDCEATLERRTDILSKQARSTAFVVNGQGTNSKVLQLLMHLSSHSDIKRI